MNGYFTTKRHEGLREAVRTFAEEEIRPLVPEMEASRSVQRELSRLIARRGWICVTISPDYGGLGLGHLAKTIIIEEVSRVSGAMGAMVQASQLGVAKIVHFGSEEQKRTWLPAISDGRCLPTIAVTEPESGGHVLGLRAHAVRDGDDYILNGRKVYVGNSHVGDLHGVVVRTGRGSGGLSAFLVERDRPGLSLGQHRAAIGLHGFSFGEFVFDNCRVPASNLLGREGDGLAVAYSSSVLMTASPSSFRLPEKGAAWTMTLITCLTLAALPRPVGVTRVGSLRLGSVASSSGRSASAPYLAARMARSR